MSVLKQFKVTALPSTLENNSIYYVTSAVVGYVEVYVTSSTGTARRVPRVEDIDAKIATAVQGLAEIAVYADISDRNTNALNNQHKYVLVRDATGDNTVTSGSATYLYDTANTAWVKVSESESIDVVLSWANITGKPTSTPASIDSAVANSHTHNNKTQLDLIGQDANGNITYNSAPVKISWDSEAW